MTRPIHWRLSASQLFYVVSHGGCYLGVRAVRNACHMGRGNDVRGYGLPDRERITVMAAQVLTG